MVHNRALPYHYSDMDISTPTDRWEVCHNYLSHTNMMYHPPKIVGIEQLTHRNCSLSYCFDFAYERE